MSQNLQEIFARVEQSKARQKEIKTIYRDALANTPEYTELNDKLKALRERKKQIEATVKEQFGKEITELSGAAKTSPQPPCRGFVRLT